jgi:hypothetical protein
MRKSLAFMRVIPIMFLFFGLLGLHESTAQSEKTPTVRKTTLTGNIAKAKHGYIIQSRRDKGPGEIFTIRNPQPKVLDELVKSKKTVSLEVRIITGDNVDIEKIDGKDYPQKAQ